MGPQARQAGVQPSLLVYRDQHVVIQMDRIGAFGAAIVAACFTFDAPGSFVQKALARDGSQGPQQARRRNLFHVTPTRGRRIAHSARSLDERCLGKFAPSSFIN